MKSIAIITARGGSKRIPRKNIKEFCGKPIIAYSIEAAVCSELFDEVMVSTDDEEIASVARQYGAKVPFYRSEATSNDFASTKDVLLEVLKNYADRGQDFDVAACIYPTAPFVTASKLQAAFREFLENDADVLVPVVRFSYPPQRAMVIREGRLVFEYPQYQLARSQDLEPQYHDAGQFYLFHTHSFMKNGNLLAGNIDPYIISELEVQDIDTQTDWELAEEKYKLMREKN